ncbi:MAG TPA: hypothetical protein VFJ64_03760 [Solirubrobacterales bacterium]|nr:hypothetical protein [Solirubrobacterales bacterium]
MPTAPRKTFAATALATFALVFAGAPVAWGAAEPVGEGQTALKLNASLYESLQRSGIRLVKLKPGKMRGRTATMPASGGTLDAPKASAVVTHEGGFKLRGQRREVVVRKLILDIPAKQLRGQIGGRTLTIASLPKIDGAPDGFGAKIAVHTLRLTRLAALALNRALGLASVFAGGRSLGSISSVVQPEAVTIARGMIALGGEVSTFARLESLGVDIGLWGSSSRFGERGSPPIFLFEVASGKLGPDASTGLVTGEGGLTLQRPEPDQDLLLLTPIVDLGSGVLSAGLSTLSGANLAYGPIATLDTSAATTRIKGASRMELTDVKAIATQFLADRLNATFDPPTPFTEGETLGELDLVLYTGS